MKKYEETDGVWRTVRGRRIFIRKGEDLASAMKRSGKFDNLKREDVTKGRFDLKKDELREKAQKNLNKAQENYKKAENNPNDKKRHKYHEEYEKEYSKYKKKENKIKEYNKLIEEYDNPKEATDFKGIKGKHIDKKQVENAKYNETKQDVLEYFGEDFGYEDTTPEKAFVEQIDSMRNPGENIHDTAKRFAEGGSMLVYNQDMAEYLNKKGIKTTEDDAFDKYTEYMATNMEKMYNEYKNDKVNKINAFKEKKQSNNNFDYTKRYSPKELEKFDDATLEKLKNSHNALYEEYSNKEKPSDLRTRNGKMENTFNRAMASNYEYGLKEIDAEIEKRGLEYDQSLGKLNDTKAKIEAFKEKKQSNNAPKINKTLEKKGKVNQKTLKSYADDGMATDITRFSDKEIDNLEKKHGRLTHVKTSMGTYGMNGALLKSEKTGEYFVITSRNSTLFRLV